MLRSEDTLKQWKGSEQGTAQKSKKKHPSLDGVREYNAIGWENWDGEEHAEQGDMEKGEKENNVYDRQQIAKHNPLLPRNYDLIFGLLFSKPATVTQKPFSEVGQ